MFLTHHITKGPVQTRTHIELRRTGGRHMWATEGQPRAVVPHGRALGHHRTSGSRLEQMFHFMFTSQLHTNTYNAAINRSYWWFSLLTRSNREVGVPAGSEAQFSPTPHLWNEQRRIEHQWVSWTSAHFPRAYRSFWQYFRRPEQK